MSKVGLGDNLKKGKAMRVGEPASDFTDGWLAPRSMLAEVDIIDRAEGSDRTKQAKEHIKPAVHGEGL